VTPSVRHEAGREKPPRRAANLIWGPLKGTAPPPSRAIPFRQVPCVATVQGQSESGYETRPGQNARPTGKTRSFVPASTISPTCGPWPTPVRQPRPFKGPGQKLPGRLARSISPPAREGNGPRNIGCPCRHRGPSPPGAGPAWDRAVFSFVWPVGQEPPPPGSNSPLSVAPPTKVRQTASRTPGKNGPRGGDPEAATNRLRKAGPAPSPRQASCVSFRRLTSLAFDKDRPGGPAMGCLVFKAPARLSLNRPFRGRLKMIPPPGEVGPPGGPIVQAVFSQAEGPGAAGASWEPSQHRCRFTRVGPGRGTNGPATFFRHGKLVEGGTGPGQNSLVSHTFGPTGWRGAWSEGVGGRSVGAGPFRRHPARQFCHRDLKTSLTSLPAKVKTTNDTN